MTGRRRRGPGPLSRQEQLLDKIDRALDGKLDDFHWLLAEFEKKNISPEVAVLAAGLWLGRAGRDKARLALAVQMLEEHAECGYLDVVDVVDDVDED